MDSGGLGFWRTVWASILAGVAVVAIVAAASWAFGFHHQVWLAIVAVVGWLWGVLAYSVPVPVSLLAIFAGFVLYVWRSAVLRKREPLAERTAESAHAAATVAQSAPPSDNEIKVVRLLAMADGKSMTRNELAPRAALSNLVTDQAIERLLNRKFVVQIINTAYRQAYILSPEGRDYAIAEGYVRRPLAATAPRA